MTSLRLRDEIRDRFSVALPLFVTADEESVKLELKPYLQPFERGLAMRELSAMLDAEDVVIEEHGLFVVRTKKSEDFLRQHLTFWQRLGRSHLSPTQQTLLEFTQNGMERGSGRASLHGARRLRYGPHDLHEYRGKFFPQLVRSLISVSGVPAAALVLDPMCGSGTTPCEALALGMHALGADLNPLSVLIANVKASLVLERPSDFLEKTTRYLEKFNFTHVSPYNVWQEHDLLYLGKWFDPEALADVAAIVAEIRGVDELLYRDFFAVCLSNIIRSVSWQKEADLRVRKEVVPYASGTAVASFTEIVREQIAKIHPYLCVLSRDETTGHLEIRLGNAVSIASLFPSLTGKVDLLVTSPPYATALPYLDTDRLSLIVLGLLSRAQHKMVESEMVGTREVSESERRGEWKAYLARRRELPGAVSSLIDFVAGHNHGDGVGFRRRNLPSLLGKYYLDMLDAMRSARLLMVPGANGFYVVGNNSTSVDGEKVEIPTDKFLFEIAAAAGWNCRESIPMELLHSRDIFKENRGSSETILCLTA
jgi:site-specific DNA-methyltransferase (cytosine-N4-specific)